MAQGQGAGLGAGASPDEGGGEHGPTAGKSALRQAILSDMARLGPRARFQEEDAIVAQILADPVWQRARVLLLYRSHPPEVSTVALANAAWRAGKTVLFPRVKGDDLELVVCRSWDDLEPGAFGIPEPRLGLAAATGIGLDLAVVPGVGFTLEGHRLGRGRGFYDRFLPGLACPSWGLAFACQVKAALPLDTHDVRVDRVVHPGSSGT